MYMTDFEYNGERLSDYHLMLCSFDGTSDIVDIGNVITMNMVKAPNSHRQMSVGHSYDDTFTVTLQVSKISCDNNVDNEIREDEVNRIVRWLNRKRFCKFKPIYDDFAFSDVYYKATFNIRLIKYGNKIVGLELTLITDAPFGYKDNDEYNYEFTSSDDEFIVYDISDEVGYLYCDAIITCKESGNLIITNEFDRDNDVIINNCTQGEIIRLRGTQKIIENLGDVGHSTLCNDFNYNFLRISNSYDNNENVFKSSLKCEIELQYSPVRKVGIVV